MLVQSVKASWRRDLDLNEKDKNQARSTGPGRSSKGTLPLQPSQDRSPSAALHLRRSSDFLTPLLLWPGFSESSSGWDCGLPAAEEVSPGRAVTDLRSNNQLMALQDPSQASFLWGGGQGWPGFHGVKSPSLYGTLRMALKC